MRRERKWWLLLVGMVLVGVSFLLKDDYYGNMLRSAGIAWVVIGAMALRSKWYYRKHEEEYAEKMLQQTIDAKDERKLMLRRMAGHRAYQFMYFVLLVVMVVLALLRVEVWVTGMVLILWWMHTLSGIYFFRLYDKKY